MKTYQNPNLLHLQALFIDNSDSHARQGAHVRVAHHPLLELPVAPFVLERADIDEKLLPKLQLRNEALFIDQNGRRRLPPFSMARGDVITIKLPTGRDILPLWAQIVMDPSSRVMPTAIAYLRSTGQEDVLLGARHDIPLAFTGTGIVRMVLRGVGTVVGVQWLNAGEIPSWVQFQTVDVLNLPHPGGRRYAVLPAWKDLCVMRRDRQAPRRRPLQDTTGAPPRFSAPGFNSGLEEQRVGAFFDEIDPLLDRLINDIPAQLDQFDEREMTRPNGDNISQDDSAVMTIRTLGLFLQAQADPGMASFCGYKTLDRDHLDRQSHALSIYRLTAFFRNPARHTLDNADEAGELFGDHIRAAREQAGLLAPDDAEKQWRKLADRWLAAHGMKAMFDLERRNCLALQAMAIADHRVVLDPPPKPRLDPPEHIHWLPSDDSDAPRRVTETYVRGLISGAAMAATRRQPIDPARWTPLNNAIPPSGWRALILPNIPGSGPFARGYGNDLPDAFLSDAETGPDVFRMFVAQSDRFGRYSDWGAVQGDAGPRPKPPRPVLQGSYRQPDISTGLHRGKVTLTVPLPEAETLAPGAFELTHASLTATHNGAAFAIPSTLNPMSVSDAISIHPDAPVPPEDDRRGLRISFDGPALAATSTSEMTFTARWHDSAGQVSEPSEVLKLRLTDPYPPAQMPIPDTLMYSARPDATGKAWVERRWPDAGSHVRYAVYYADENRLRAYLRDPDGRAVEAATLLATLEATDDPAARATALRARQDLFPDYLFERLKDVMLETDASGQTGFRHALSGSLRVLSAYKIVAEAAATSARPDLGSVDTVFYAVPNSDPPAQPVVTARQVEPMSEEPELVVELTVTLRPGVTLGQTVRLRRTRSGEADAMRNPIIGTATLGDVDAGTGLQTAVLRDTGPALIAPSARLAPFTKYAWIAEAQGAPEPGSTATSDGAVAGLWSKPSVPATLDVIPGDPPVAPELVRRDGVPVANGGIRGLTMEFSYPLNLVPTSLGPWIVVVDRRLPGQTATRIMERAADAGATIVVPGDPDNPNFVVPAGTFFRLRLRDPIGRQGEVVDLIV